MVCIGIAVKRTMYQCKVDVDMLNTNTLFTVFSISISTLYVDTLYVWYSMEKWAGDLLFGLKLVKLSILSMLFI